MCMTLQLYQAVLLQVAIVFRNNTIILPSYRYEHQTQLNTDVTHPPMSPNVLSAPPSEISLGTRVHQWR